MAIQYSDRMRPEEAFKRGFYYGLGFWISGIFLNVAAAVVIFFVLLGLGVISSVALSPPTTNRTVAPDAPHRVTVPARGR